MTKPVPTQPTIRRKVKIGALLMLTAALAFSTGLGIAAFTTKPKIVIPDSIVSSADFTLYTPQVLPDGFRIVEGSFRLQEGAVLFQAENDAGSTLTFSQQKRPENVDAIISELFDNPRHLRNVPYPSIIGTSNSNRTTLLSVETNNTWILVTTQHPINDDVLVQVARSVVKSELTRSDPPFLRYTSILYLLNA